ncbi:MAG: hypothetical protein H7832_04830 [Magnetococcus sp. DMHC-6]
MINKTSLKASDLKRLYGVFGCFYQIFLAGELHSCRNILELIAHEKMPKNLAHFRQLVPDLLVVMMNPGSSHPLDLVYQPPLIENISAIEPLCQWVPTQPDNTQYQVMRLMANRGLTHARILNLSDLREPKSPNLIQKVERLRLFSDGGGHSVFSPERRHELAFWLGKSEAIPVLVGWGRHPGLRPLAENCLMQLVSHRVIGLPIENHHWAFAHPSPMLQKMKDRWLQEILARWP